MSANKRVLLQIQKTTEARTYSVRAAVTTQRGNTYVTPRPIPTVRAKSTADAAVKFMQEYQTTPLIRDEVMPVVDGRPAFVLVDANDPSVLEMINNATF